MSEPTNEDRAEWAQQALDVFAAETFSGTTFSELVEQKKYPFTETDAPDMLRDLITNLYHLGLAHGMDVERLRDGCFGTFEEEHQEEATFDQANDSFDASPSEFTANVLEFVANQYHGDDMIGDDTFNAAMEKVSNYRIAHS